LYSPWNPTASTMAAKCPRWCRMKMPGSMTLGYSHGKRSSLCFVSSRRQMRCDSPHSQQCFTFLKNTFDRH
jgi:hypothetical protein